MEIKSLYSNKLQTKTGSFIPVLNNGRTIESKYNPEREAENLLNSINTIPEFIIVFGVASGIFIKQCFARFPKAFILGVENTQADIDFLQDFQNVQEISKNKNFFITTIADFKQNLTRLYLPSLYGNLKIIEILSWANENKEIMPLLKDELNSAIKAISADFSVQAHFGKIWQKNILNNLYYCQNHQYKINFKTDKKTAAVIAAGPTLDSKIEVLKKERQKLYIISTDTAYQTLIKNNIYPEIVVSLDGQFLSHEHFMNTCKEEPTIFAFDLCSSNSCIRNIPSNKLFFFNSGHPLSVLASSAKDADFPELYSGAGTVTITAFDLAKNLGFSEIQVYAADFSYVNGKAYSKGTYLDSIYRNNDNKLFNSETSFTKLMFRTELITISEIAKTTEVLNSYKSSFEEYLKNNNFNFEKKEDIYFTNCSNKIKNLVISNHFSFDSFLELFKSEYDKNNYLPLLPYISYLRIKNPSSAFEDFLKLAYSELVSYNNKI